MRRLATPTRLFVAGFVLLQCAWVLTLPPFRGIDEFDHVYRAAAVAGGDWVADQAPDDGRGLLLEVPPDIVAAAHGQCAKLRYTGPDNCSPAGEAPDGRVLVASGAATYHPAFYWVVGTAGAPFEGATSLYVMRAVTALLCALFVALAAWSATRGPTGWPLVGLGVALTPVLVYSTTVVAPNGLELAAAVALWTSLLRLRAEPDPAVGRRLVLVAVLSAAVMCTLRFLGPFWVVLVVVAVAAYDPRGTRDAVVRHGRLVLAGVAVVLVSLANYVTWLVVPAAVTVPDDGAEVREDLSPLHLVLWAVQSIAAFPYRNQLGPAAVYVVVGVLAVLLLVLGVRSASTARRLVIVGSLVAALLVPLAATVLTTDGGEIIWQGRYGLPLGVGFVLMSAYAVADRAERSGPVAVPRVAAAAAGAAYVVAVAWSLLQVRHDELTDNPASVADPAWHAPAPALLVGLVVLAVAAALAAGWRQEARAAGPSGTDPVDSADLEPHRA